MTSLHVFPTISALCDTLREYILAAQDIGLSRHSTFKIGVSGGSLPTQLAQALLSPSSASSSSQPQFSKWEIFFCDERLVPLDHDDSNYRLLKDDFLSKIPSSSAAASGQPTVHTIDVSALSSPQECAARYEQTIVSSFASRDSVRLPAFDLLLLGCGPDGHTCSLFPGHKLLREADAWVVSIEDSPKPPAQRITLTLPVVTHAHKVAFVATGEAKSNILGKIFEGRDGGDELPCAMVGKAAGDRCSWFVDEEAVKGVKYPRKSAL